MDRGLLLSKGARLGDYVVDEFVAAGSVSEVYRAHDLSRTGTSIALKVFLHDALTDGGRQRFLREATALRDVKHPHLAEVFDHGQSADGQLLFYAMRFISGDSLGDVLDECERIGPPTPEHLRFLVARICDVAAALDELHRRGLVHRDVKPDNIVLRRPADGSNADAEAVLVDYGLVRPVLAGWNGMSTVQVSLPYAAPEQLRGGRVDARVDVFSLGTTLYDVVCGRRSRHRGLAAFGLAPLEQQVPTVDRDLAAIVSCATDVDPAWRYPDARSLRDDLRRWLRGRPAQARLPPIRRLRRWVHQHPHRALRAVMRVGIVATLALALGFLAWEVSRLCTSRARAIDAWESGDLAIARQAIENLPARLDGLLLPPELRAAAAALRGDDRDAPIAAVLRAQRERGKLAEMTEVVTRLANASGDPNRELVRMAAFRLIGALADRGDELAGLTRIFGRFFNECPTLDPSAVERMAPIRILLGRALRESGDPTIELFALSALCGCAVPSTAKDVVEWLQLALAREDVDATEACRLVIRCLEYIASRSRRCGFSAELAGQEWREAVRTLQATAQSIRDRLGPDDMVMVHAVEDLLVACVYVRRSSDSNAVDAGFEGFGCDQPLYRAATLDPAFARELSRAVDDETSMQTGPNYGWYVDLGSWVGALGRSELVDDFVSRVRRHAARRDIEPAWAEALFRRGVEVQLQRLRDTWTESGLDPQTTLREISRRPNRSETIPAVRRVGSDPASVGAAWNFTMTPFELGGSAGEVRLLDSVVGEDECDPKQSRFVALGIPGRSELELVYRLAGGDRSQPVLGVDVQKAVRGGFPFRGEARLEVILDGVRVFDGLAPTDGLVEWRQPVRPTRAVDERTHVLRLRLAPDSTTTLRIFSVSVGVASAR